ncbi:MAG: CaiB/BaiF CoA transferase family protein, partial [Dehalococcoidia bacterium]
MTGLLPLEGVRICDFTAVWAGQSATMYLADLGAECIKVENPGIWNPMTRAASPRINAQTAAYIPAWIGGHPDSDPGPRPWNNSPAFIHVLRNKKSVTVDSRTPEGLALVKLLLRVSDVVAENLAIGTLEKLGLDDDAIRAVNPEIIIVHVPAFGRSGPYIQGRGYGSHMDAVGGGTILRGYRDSGPLTNVQIVPSDFVSGMHAAVATLAALRHRRRTGKGQVIEAAQNETAAQMFPQAALDAAWNGRVHSSLGNRSVEGFVPNGAFPTRGENEWIAISCRDDVEWLALAAAMGSPAWATATELEDAPGRARREDEVEERLAAWTATQERYDLFHKLQAAGVTAGPVMTAKDAAEDPQLRAGDAWTQLEATADYPATEFAVPPFHFSKSDVTLRTPPALFGEHNDYVYREVLGLSDGEVERYRALGHIR